jgi:tetratricopeptide (TPR) repeat protein
MGGVEGEMLLNMKFSTMFLICVFIGLVASFIILTRYTYWNHTPSDTEERAGALFKQGKMKQAIELWENDIKATNSFSTRNKLGVAYLSTNQIDKALYIFQEGVKQKPDWVEGNFNIALIKYNNGDYESAIAYIDNVIRKNPEHLKAHYVRGRCLIKLGDVKNAQKAFIKELNINPSCIKSWNHLNKLNSGGNQ